MDSNLRNISRLSAKKRLLLQHLLNEEQATNSQVQTRLTRAAIDVFPLSFAQEQLWFLEQLLPGNIFYNVPLIIQCTGDLNIELLAQCIKKLVNRHDALRTTFPMLGESPRQVIAPDMFVPLEFSDISQREASEEQSEEARKPIQEEIERPFDLSNGPLLRTRVFRLAPGRHLVLITMHHIICDGRSLEICRRDLMAFYNAALTGQAASLPDLPIRFADFAFWQRQYLQETRLETLTAYWRSRLSPFPPQPTLSLERPQCASPSRRAALESFLLSPQAFAQLKEISRQEEMTLYTILVASFSILLYRYTGQTDTALGLVISGRTRSETEHLIGFFANMLVLRTKLSSPMTFRQVIAYVKTTLLDAYEHQDLPFEHLVKVLQPGRDADANPLVRIVFAQQPALEPYQIEDTVSFSFEEGDSRHYQFDLEVHIKETPDGLYCAFKYSTDHFQSGSIQRLWNHYRHLLETAATNRDTPITHLPLLTAYEARQILLEWNDTKNPFPQDRTVPCLFAKQASRTPHALAYSSEGQQLTYRELNRRANRLARALQKKGVRPETRVGLYVDRSLELIIGMLGILKAGGVYVPLDPAYPQERLAFILVDAQIRLLVGSRQIRSDHTLQEVPWFDLHADWKTLEYEDPTDLPLNSIADNLAYIMYTSGSSGTPKGIGISHRAIISLLYNTNYIQITAADRIAQASNASFDAATFEIWGALLYGAQIVGVEKETLLSERRLVEHIQKNRISILFVTTALFNQIAREFPQAFKPLRCLLFGGEAVNPHWVKVILAEESPQQLLHMYGPTETTTFATWHAIATVEEKATTIPIGKPLTNTQVYVVDAYMQLLPVGIPGELYIGGTGLARGYISNPELTAEYFIPDPFSQEPGARLYKTGDLVRYLPTGEIEYLSRLGQQVKLRGYRIELAEIEAVISRHPAIQEIAVIAREDRETDKYLAAYLVLKPACVLTAQDLQTYLQAKLPDYMIPSAFAYLSALPLNPNGKVDRRNLPVPEMIRLMPEGTYVAPQTPQEESLARIWTEILGLEQVGIYDNFFKLGGHSLLATQITSRIRTDFHVDLPLRVLFDTPTIDGLARAITTRQQASSNVQETHIKPLPRKAR